jgi:hypothetical protein
MKYIYSDNNINSTNNNDNINKINCLDNNNVNNRNEKYDFNDDSSNFYKPHAELSHQQIINQFMTGLLH